MRTFALLLTIACSGLLAERRKPDSSGPTLVRRTAAALMADSASICWQRFSRGAPVETSCTSLGVTARVDTLRDTLRIQLPSPPPVTFAFGPVDLYRGPDAHRGFNAGLSYADPKVLLSLLAKLRANNQRAFLALTGGSHEQWITGGRFDLAKW